MERSRRRRSQEAAGDAEEEDDGAAEESGSEGATESSESCAFACRCSHSSASAAIIVTQYAITAGRASCTCSAGFRSADEAAGLAGASPA